MLVELGLAAEPANLLRCRLGVVDFKEEVGAGTFIAPVQAAVDVWSLDLESVCLARGSRIHLPAEQLRVATVPGGGMPVSGSRASRGAA